MWRNVIGHSIYQIVVLVAIIFACQGTFVEHYDIKCLAERESNGACPQGKLNPFYAANRYFELATQKYWTTENAMAWKETDFESKAFNKFQC
jgi:hypothetical protein